MDGTILHAELLDLVDRVPPTRFGGGPADYQLVETETRATGASHVQIVVSPRVGPLAEGDVVETVLAVVAAGPKWREMTATLWGDGDTVEVVRREPYPTPAGKLHAFHRTAP